MISLKKLFHGSESGEFPRTTALILEAIALHAIHLDDEEHRQFQESIRTHARALTATGITPAESMLVAGATIQSLETFARQSELQIKKRLHELNTIGATLAAALAAAHEGHPRIVTGLQSIEKQLLKASQLDEIQAIRRKLDECLAAVHVHHAEARSTASPADAAALSHRISEVPVRRDPLSPKTDHKADHRIDHDVITGLSGRDSAQEAIKNAIEAGGSSAAVPVLVARIATVNARLGRKSGDKLLLAMGQTLAQKLGPKDKLFRWHGPCFLAVIERTASVEAIRGEMASLLGRRIDHTVVIDDREILVPGWFSWTVLPLWESLTADEVCEQIDNFVLKEGTTNE